MFPSKEIASRVSTILKALDPWVVSLSSIKWQPSDGTLPLIYRGVLRRQFDCLQSILLLVEHDRGYAAAPLLRAACEEVLWVRYLMRLTTPDAERLLTIIAGSELNDSLAAQAAYSDPKVMRKLGLAQHLKAMAAGGSQRTAALRVLGKKLQWPKRSVESGRLPSVSFIAKSVGMKEEYDFLYHASSRYVHFSVAELLRRAWGKSGEVTLESSHFNTYWGAFAAFWGINLFIEALTEIGEWLPDSEQIPELEEAEILRAADELGKIGQVPIITAAELYWDTDKFLSG